MDSHDDMRQNLIASAIAAGEAAHGDADEARVLPWRQLFTHLNPLIGESGLIALYRRAVRLVSAQYDWLETAPASASASADELLTALRGQFASAGSVLAREANQAMLSTFTKLLSSLIGEALTIRLLDSAWYAGGTTKAREQK